MGRAQPVIREYGPGDRAAVSKLLAGSEPWMRLGYGAADWDRLFQVVHSDRDRQGYVASCDGAVSAIALVRPKFLLGDYLELLAVAPAARGQGVGAALLAFVETIVFARTRNLFVCVSDFNEDARRFYARQGYHEIGPIPNLLINGSAELLLRKTRGPARETTHTT